MEHDHNNKEKANPKLQPDHSKIDHSQIGHHNMKPEEVPSPTLDHKIEAAVSPTVDSEIDHSKMDHSKMKMPARPSGGDDKEMDHSKMNMNSGGHASHGTDHTGMIADFKKRFFVVLALTLPIVLLSPMIQQWLNVDWQFKNSNYILFALSSIVFFYGGWPFLKGWWDEMKNWKPGM